jgi:hypothetical protein
MEAEGPRRSRVGRRTALWVAAVAAAVALVMAGAAALLGGDDDEGEDTITGPPGNQFTLERPAGWRQVPEDERERLPGQPLAVLRRDKGRGLVIVDAPARSERDLDAVSKQLDSRLQNEIGDFRRVGAREVRVKAGRALLYSYARTRRGTAHTVLVVPAADRTYTVNAVVPAGADDAARDVGRILLSFDL